MLRYDAPTTYYTSAIPPGTSAFRRVVGPHFGFTRVEVVRDRSRCQSQRSRHCQCAAIDFFTTDLSPVGKGRLLFEWALANANALNIQGGIFNRRCFGLGGTWAERPYTGKHPHTDHVHIELNNHGAANLTEALVRAHLTGGDDDMQRAEIENELQAIARIDADTDLLQPILNEVKALRAEVAQLKAAVESPIEGEYILTRKP